MNSQAERWGVRTAEAALVMDNHRALQEIIDDAWPDISFGYSQAIVKYHYLGDGSPSIANILAVRAAVLANPARDVLEMAKRLQACRSQALSVGRVDDLAPLIIYNAGHWPSPNNSYWVRYAANVTAYTSALAAATGMLASNKP